ncbi:amino acid ABC transporter substrate-binding pro tein [Desulfonema ishimotonii]|uniref:Amino acid ABC transporter substrate-binding pro tein n=1 Tax=Desulfonema ishimotonii TaxID=45657 RepID=A0A401FU57_9BACT|nr:transporter substrate-binding domain-containing protein [Desulfonema ishimotonii]GBC60484.1 amino acid ABC transporter substrate-binding pro tein [Desulfonema ishimotonii]
MKLMKWSIIAILCVVIRTPCLFAGEIEQIRAKGEIVVSLNKGYPPFSMMTDNQISGLDVDLATLLADYLGVRVRFIRPESYDQQIPRLLAGDSDIIIAAMTRTVERGLKVSFTDPYFEISQAALVQRELVPVGADSYFDLLETDQLRLGVKADTTHEKFALELFPEKAIRRYPTADAAADGLLRGEVNAMVADSPFVRVWRDTHPEHYLKIAALLAPVTKEYYAFAIRQGDPVFLNWLNLFIDQIRIDGTLELLEYEYFEQMPWAKKKAAAKEKLTRAQLLKNKFVARKKAMIEERRKALMKTKPDYD